MQKSGFSVLVVDDSSAVRSAFSAIIKADPASPCSAAPQTRSRPSI